MSPFAGLIIYYTWQCYIVTFYFCAMGHISFVNNIRGEVITLEATLTHCEDITSVHSVAHKSLMGDVTRDPY